MRVSASGAAVLAVLLLGAAAPVQASPYVLTLDQVGSNIIASGSGRFDLNGLTYCCGANIFISSYMLPNFGRILMGPAGGYDDYFGATGPTIFGSGSFLSASTHSGDGVGMYGDSGTLFVPLGYRSGTDLSNSATYDNVTLAELGLSVGTYKWTWGTHTDQSFTLVIEQSAATPVPATLPLLASGLAALGLLGRRRKQKAAAVAKTAA